MLKVIQWWKKNLSPVYLTPSVPGTMLVLALQVPSPRTHVSPGTVRSPTGAQAVLGQQFT